tara:strand:+ start:74 stop:985 length:912 start_codon:yes stop_codon:yes gene_type:complete
MKKFLAILFLGLLWCNVSFAEKIILECKFPTGAKFGGSFDIDTVKKKVNQYPFEKGSTDKIIKSASFNKVQGSIWNAYFFTINLNNDTIELVRVDNLDLKSPKARKAYKNDDIFSLIPPNSIKIVLNCKRIGAPIDFSKNNIAETSVFNCVEPENKFKSNLTVIKKIDEEHIILKETMDMNMGFELSTIHFAKILGDHIAFFIIYSDGTKELTYANLYPDDNGKRELRYLIFKLTNIQYDKLNNLPLKFGKLEGVIKNYNLTNSELKKEIKLYDMQVKTWRELTKSKEVAVDNLVGGSRFFCE